MLADLITNTNVVDYSAILLTVKVLFTSIAPALAVTIIKCPDIKALRKVLFFGLGKH
jgi:hypothetical protein